MFGVHKNIKKRIPKTLNKNSLKKKFLCKILKLYFVPRCLIDYK